MAVNLCPPTELLPVSGVRVGVTAAGIRYQGRDDMVLIELAEGSSGAAVFTRNAFAAAPVTVSQDRFTDDPKPLAILINSGNANAGTGRAGHDAALASSVMAATATGIADEKVWLASTGVIGECLPTAPIEAAIPKLVSDLDADNWLRAARAIMTTDSEPKGISETIQIDGATVTITGIAKGAGMIRPDMATMLAFVATDAKVAPALLQKMLVDANAASFNCISVDGDTSTNDTCYLLATGQSDAREIEAETAAATSFQAALNRVCRYLALSIVRDGEGATHVAEIRVDNASDPREARQVAEAIAHSPLVKTAMFAADPNWGRILAAVGRSGIPELDISRVDLYLDDLCVVRSGEPDPGYTESRGAEVMSRPEYRIGVQLSRGSASAHIWTCDLGHDYVRINAEYRT